MSLTCNVRESDGVSYLQGHLTFESYPSMRETLGSLLHHDAPRHVIDLSALQHIDSAGLGMLLIASEEMRRASKTLVFRGPAGQVRRVLEVTEFHKVASVED